MEFEFDKSKHGIDFDEAQALWLDEMLVEVPARAALCRGGADCGQALVCGHHLPQRQDPAHLGSSGSPRGGGDL